MKEDLIALLKKIDALKLEIESLRPLPPEREGKIFQKLRLDWNFHSNAIEGNSLTYGETMALLLDGLTALGKPIKDHDDIRGHNEAINFITGIVESKGELTERDIRELHKTILVKRFQSKAQTPDGQPTLKWVEIGQYKTQPNSVLTPTGEMFYFASPEETPAMMHDLMGWYRENREKLHPVALAAEFHYRFVMIHPFDDGNGRMSRLLMNFILMEFGYLPAIVRNQNRGEYIQALRAAQGRDIDSFVFFTGENLLRSMDLYLRGARGEDISEAGDLDKEIALFVKSFEGEDTVRIKRDAEIWKTEFNIQLTELVQQINNRSPEFEQLFVERIIIICGKTKKGLFTPAFAFGKPTGKENLSLLIENTSVQYIHIDFHFQGFKRISPPINFIKKMRFKLAPFSFSIEIESPLNTAFGEIQTFKPILEIGYGIPILEKHIRPIEETFFKALMAEIKQKTQKQ